MNTPVPFKTNGDKIPVAKTHNTQLRKEANKLRNSNKRKNSNNEDNKRNSNNEDNKSKLPKRDYKDDLHCTYCGKDRHTAEFCFANPNAKKELKMVSVSYLFNFRI